MIDRIYEKRKKSNTCYISSRNKFDNFFEGEDKSKTFSIVPHLSLDALVKVVKAFIRRDSFTEESLEIYQPIRTFITLKGLRIEKRNCMEKCVRLFTEPGFAKKLYQDLPNYTGLKLEKQGDEDGFVHYGSLQDYMRTL